MPDTLMVPPQLEGLARLICEGEYVPQVYGSNTAAAPQPNMLKGTLKALVVPEFYMDPTTWYLLDTSNGIKPFIYQLREAPNFVSLISPSDPKVFWEKKLTFGVDMRAAVGFGPWWLAAKAVA
jgi:phage major head subunit gpT-like protein